MNPEINFGTWLLQQTPTIVVLGVVVWWLARQYLKLLDRLATLQEKSMEREKESIKVTTQMVTFLEQLMEEKRPIRRTMVE